MQLKLVLDLSRISLWTQLCCWQTITKTKRATWHHSVQPSHPSHHTANKPKIQLQPTPCLACMHAQPVKRDSDREPPTAASCTLVWLCLSQLVQAHTYNFQSETPHQAYSEPQSITTGVTRMHEHPNVLDLTGYSVAYSLTSINSTSSASQGLPGRPPRRFKDSRQTRLEIVRPCASSHGVIAEQGYFILIDATIARAVEEQTVLLLLCL
jgi:hypothetical protein